MELRINDYVRTKYGEIGKIIYFQKAITFKPKTYKEKLDDVSGLEEIIYVDTHYHFEDENDNYFQEDIVKSSPDIIDLIEVGDYVNDNVVKELNDELVIMNTGLIYDNNLYLSIKQIDIKSIVTHEQFESMEYKL